MLHFSLSVFPLVGLRVISLSKFWALVCMEYWLVPPGPHTNPEKLLFIFPSFNIPYWRAPCSCCCCMEVHLLGLEPVPRDQHYRSFDGCFISFVGAQEPLISSSFFMVPVQYWTHLISKKKFKYTNHKTENPLNYRKKNPRFGKHLWQVTVKVDSHRHKEKIARHATPALVVSVHIGEEN